MYFLVIFTSHFVLEMTLNLARVSAGVSFWVTRNDVQCDSLGIDPTSSRNVSRHRSTMDTSTLIVFFRLQRYCCVSPVSRPRSLIQTADARFQVPSRDGLANNALVEKSCGFAAGKLVPCRTTCK